MTLQFVHLLYLFIVGTFFGSFLNVVVDRLPKGQSIIAGRSRCDFCKRTILWRDLIPVVSFLLLKGKCRFCHKSLGYYYPLVELTSGGLFLLAALHAFSFPELLFLLGIVSVLLVIFFADLKYGIIPFPVVIAGLLMTALQLISLGTDAIIVSLLSAVGAALFFFAIFFFTKGRGMGFGDVVYAFFMGLLLGFPGIVIGLYLGFLTGAVVSLILIAAGKKRLKGDTIPFGPFLVFGTLAALLYQQEIVTYVRSFLQI